LVSAQISAQTPDLGPNILLLTPATPRAEAQAAIDRIYAVQQYSEFGPARNAILLTPGDYHLDIPVGFYTELRGLGASPDATHITGNIHADASRAKNNATCTFWRGAENLAITPTGGDIDGAMQWAVSQAVFLRRVHVLGNLTLHQHRGWASGGWLADSLIDGAIDSGTQQQWITRNSDFRAWTGSNWNMVFVGVPHAPADSWPKPPFTNVARTPVIREKPFLTVDAANHWSVFVPALQSNTAGPSWSATAATRDAMTAGHSIPLSHFYIAHADRDTVAMLNTALASGKNLLLTPGIYSLDAPLHITHANTIVLGIGFATLKPTHGTAAIITADVDGITLAGLLFDAGEQLSPSLVEIGPAHSGAHHEQNPIGLFDVFFRVGGAGPGSATSDLIINAADTLIDHTWIWRADHGAGVGWTTNRSDNGIVVNADRVTAYGLFVEHHQQFQVLWNGNRGRTYFFQSEIPYDPPTQATYTSAPQTDGWAAYKVAANITSHEAFGLGIYSVFRHPEIFLTSAIETPIAPDLHFHHMITVCLGDNGGIRNVIDSAGGSTVCKPRTEPTLADFPPPPK
jgi:hypothetical protein